MTMSPVTRTMRVWITDGSLVPFSDVVRLGASHRSVFGLKATYKGLIDPVVAVGQAPLAMERPDDVFAPEAEWCLLAPGGFDRYVAEPERFDLTAPVIMQGLIEGKWLNRLLGARTWAPATIGNNLLADGPGIGTSLAAIEAGVAGEVAVTYTTSHGESRTMRGTLRDLMGQNLLGLVRAVLAHARQTGQSIDAIDLSAMGEAAAVVNDRRRVRAGLRFRRFPAPNPLNVLHPYDVGQRVLRQAIADGVGAMPNAAIDLRVTDGSSAVVGQGLLRLQAAPRRVVAAEPPAA